jgi:hypothetical protein
MTPREHLTKRGIAAQADLAGWQEGDGRWLYPIFNLEGEVIAHRGKAFPSNQKGMKYSWSPSKPENPASDWYILVGTKEAIATANGVAYLANGEPALLAYRAAGIQNVIATTHGETTIPQNLNEVLNALSIKRLLNVADSDKSGRDAAQKWGEECALLGIEYQALSWPESLAEKADANDLWQTVNFDAPSFQLHLANLKPLAFEARPMPVKRASEPIDFTGIHAKLLEQVHVALSTRGVFTGKRYGHGQWLQMRCLDHEDGHASAGFSVESGVIHCFGCGVKHSITQGAELLGIAWRDLLPKTAKKPRKVQTTAGTPKTLKKAEKPDFSDYETQLAIVTELAQDKRDYEQVIADDLMARELAFDDKQFISWFSCEQVPLGVLSALLHLSSGRSNLAVIFGLLHKALRDGKLRSFFTLDEACQVLDLPRKSVNNALSEFEGFNFVSKLRTHSSYIKDSNKEKVSKETTQNPKSAGRPACLYVVELSQDEWRKCLIQKLEIYWREKLINRAMSKRSPEMALGLGLDDEQFAAWKERGELAAKEKLSKEANRAFELEFYGDGTNWRGWEAALKSPYSMPLDWKSISDVRSLRVAILGHWITHVRATNTRDELRRLLGCSDPIIDETLAAGDMTSIKQSERVEIDQIPSSVRGMQTLFNKTQREARGKVWKFSYKINAERKEDQWVTTDERNYLKDFAKYAGRITKVFMILTTPSLQRYMTADEITEREAKQEAEQAELEAAGDDTKVIPATDTPKETAPRHVARFHDTHSYAWLYNQIRLEVHCFTMHRLVGHSVLDKDSNVLVSGKLPEIVKWLHENSAPEMTRTVANFYGKNYDEEADLAALDAIAQEAIAAAEASLVEDEIEDVDALPIMQELPFTKPTVSIVPREEKPAPVIAHEGDEYFEYLNNPYVHPMEQKYREAQVAEWCARKLERQAAQAQEAA